MWNSRQVCTDSPQESGRTMLWHGSLPDLHSWAYTNKLSLHSLLVSVHFPPACSAIPSSVLMDRNEWVPLTWQVNQWHKADPHRAAYIFCFFLYGAFLPTNFKICVLKYTHTHTCPDDIIEYRFAIYKIKRKLDLFIFVVRMQNPPKLSSWVRFLAHAQNNPSLCWDNVDMPLV